VGGEGNFPKFLKALCIVECGDGAHRVVGFRDPVERAWCEAESEALAGWERVCGHRLRRRVRFGCVLGCVTQRGRVCVP
jgi:hypothetical protein